MNLALSSHARLLITSFGLGNLRPFPGTWGSIPPVVLAAALAHFGVSPAGSAGACWIYHGVLALVLVAFCAVCVAYGDQAETAFGKKDPGSVVADETAGVCLPLMLIPAHVLIDAPHALLSFFLAFVLFRIFDIIKPWPCYQLQTTPGGWGILIDDLFAGAYAFAGTQLITRTLM